MLIRIVNRTSFLATSTGTVDFVRSAARTGFRDLAGAVTDGDLADGDVVHYIAVDSPSAPTQYEWGQGTYTNSTHTVSRTTIIGGSAGANTKVSFSVAPTVDLTALAVDYPPGQTYYVNGSTGSDNNVGNSSESPWQTVAHVNALTFQPGDTILFAGGQTFSGTTFTPPSGGVPGKPITYGSYGTGLATISVTGNASGITWSNLSDIVIQDLIVTGPVSGSTTANGVSATFSSTCRNWTLKNLTISGFGSGGIGISGSGTALLYDLQILFCSVTSCTAGNTGGLTSGIAIGGTYGAQSTGVYNLQNPLIEGCTVFSCPGNATPTTAWSGSGISMFQSFNGIIRYCTAYSNGANGAASSEPVGIWMNDCKQCGIDRCISYDNLGISDGFDIDGGCLDCYIEGCYAFGNARTGFQLYSYNDGSVISQNGCWLRSCVAQNNGVAASVRPDITVRADAALLNFLIADCTVSTTEDVGISVVASTAASEMTGEVAGNKVSVLNGTSSLAAFTPGTNASSVVNWAGNDYYAITPVWIFNGTNYTNFLAWSLAINAGLGYAGNVGELPLQPLQGDLNFLLFATRSNFASGAAGGSAAVRCPVGSTIIIGFDVHGGGALSGLVDSAGNTYSLVVQARVASSLDGEMWAAYNIQNELPVGGSWTATLSSGSAWDALGALMIPNSYYVGLDITQESASTSATTLSLASGTLNDATELIVGMINISATGPTTYTEATGFTTLGSPISGGGFGVSYQKVTTTASVTWNPAWTGVTGVSGCLATFYFAPIGSKASSQTNVAAPTAPSSTAFKMQGLAGSITPRVTGNILVVISGYCTASGTTAARGLLGQISYGTGGAPGINGAVAGTQVGASNRFEVGTTLTSAGDLCAPISWNAVVTGLKRNTAYWIDLAAQAIGATNVVALNQVSISCIEF